MFYYISFLRAPPRETHISQPITITYQITNDLRTELCPLEIDVYYSWLLELETRTDSDREHDTDVPFSNSIDITKATFKKLTVWRESNAYKEIRISPPDINMINMNGRGSQHSRRWRLMLCHNSSNTKIDLSQKPFGTSPFPVISMPVLLNSESVSKSNNHNMTKMSNSMDYASLGGKQEEINRLFSMRLIGTDAGAGSDSGSNEMTRAFQIVIREKLSFDLDKKLWDSGIGMSSWLASALSLNSLAPRIAKRLFQVHKKSSGSCRQCNILELGSGTGIASIILSALLSNEDMYGYGFKSSSTGVEYASNGKITYNIIATDLPSAMELIEHNLTINNALYPNLRPQAVVLDWDSNNLPSQITDLGHIDLILMADVTYNTSSFPSLIKTLLRLRELNAIVGVDSPEVLLGYKERDVEERTLWDMLAHRDVRLRLKEIDRVEGAGGAPVEIYLGEFDA